MSSKWRARLGLGLLGVFVLAVSIVKAPEVGWLPTGLAIVGLILVFTLFGRKSKRPSRPFKQRRLINTAVGVGALAMVYTVPDLLTGEGFPSDNWGLRLFFLVAIGLLNWFTTRPDEPKLQEVEEGTR